MSGRLEVGFDIGGTFTDTFAIGPESGERFVSKVLTTPDNPAVGALKGLFEVTRSAGKTVADISHAVHGTTIVTNAILQRQGAKAALIATAGFRDVLHIGREIRYDIYNIAATFPEPLISRALSFDVPERMLVDGTIHQPLDIDATRDILAQIRAAGAESIAVCLLHAYRNPAHEQAIGRLIEAELPGIPYSLSSDVVPEFREYERMSTTAANAYTQPLIARYLAELTGALQAEGGERQLFVMLSTGGITTPEIASRFPVRLLESGPAAGALATGYLGRALEEPHLLGFDMGGTTAKACIVDRGIPVRTSAFETAREERFMKGSGLPIRAPVIDLIEIGAGGGSLAHVSRLGLLQVGPESAEADPGPASYGNGGLHPTVTDADLLLGYLNPGFFAGGQMRLDTAAAQRAIESDVAGPLGLSSTDAAWGIYRIVNESMASAARVHFAERSRDPRRYAMVASGGAGPLHAAAVAQRLRIGRVIVPQQAGVFSSFGFLTAPAAFDFVRTAIMRLDRLNWDELNAIYAGFEATGRSMLEGAGIPAHQHRLVRSADMRYAGQMFEINVPVPRGVLTPDFYPEMSRLFHEAYQVRYGRSFPDAPVETLNWRLVATGPEPEIALPYVSELADPGQVASARKGTRAAYFGDQLGWLEMAVYDRYQLRAGHAAEGPAAIEERESTILVPPDSSFSVDRHGNVILAIGQFETTKSIARQEALR